MVVAQGQQNIIGERSTVIQMVSLVVMYFFSFAFTEILEYCVPWWCIYTCTILLLITTICTKNCTNGMAGANPAVNTPRPSRGARI